MIRALTNATLYDFDHYVENAFVKFDTVIRETGPMAAFDPSGCEAIDVYGAVVMPGLVLAHTHVYSTFVRGLSLPIAPKRFQDILDQLWWRLDRCLDLPATALSGAVAAAEYLQNGVTAIVDHHAGGAIEGSLAVLAKAMVTEAGMKAAFCFETSDRFDIAACIRENLAFRELAEPGRTAALFGLHASMSLSDATLAQVAAQAAGLPIHVHAAESCDDEDACWRDHAERVVFRFDRYGLVTPGSLFVHCVHCDDAELELLAQKGAVIAVNPTSNMNNGVGLPDVRKMQEKGIRVVLGDDGISASAASELRALYFAMRHRYGSPTAFSLGDLKKIMDDTYLFLSDLLQAKLGRIRPGYAADLVVLPYAAPTPIDPENAFGHFFFGMLPGFRPQHVFAGGHPAVMDYRIDPDLAAKAAGAQREARALWDRIAKEGIQR